MRRRSVASASCDSIATSCPAFTSSAMLIVCPTCATTYQIKTGSLGEAGRNVRCASCKNTWYATTESAVMEEVAPVPAKVAAVPAAAKQPRAEDFTADFD